MRHPDFQKIHQAFMWRYCKGEPECDVGKSYYYAWLNKMGLDDSKPYQRPQERFSWTEPYLLFLKEDEQAKYFKVEALFPLSSMNNNLYTQDELLKGARSLVGKPINWNHTREVASEVQIYDADYEDNCVECLLRVAKGSKTLDLIEKGEVVHVSIEANCLRGSELTPEGWTCKGLVFTGLALLTKDVLPGVPLTRIMPVEKLVESFMVINLNEQRTNQITQTENVVTPQATVTVNVQSPTAGIATATMSSASTTENSEAEWTTAYINDLPNSSFAVIEPAYLDGKTDDKRCRHLPFKDKDGKADLPHLRNALARVNQIEPVTDSINVADLRARAQKVLIAAAKDTGVGDYELHAKIADLEGKYETLKSQLEELKKPKQDPNQGPEEPCKCVLTKEGFWARFHQLRSAGASKSEAFRLVSLEVIEAATKRPKI